jgi:hypothetical protein
MSEYITKDSGERQSFSTGAVRDTRSGKGRFDLISPVVMRRLAFVYGGYRAISPVAKRRIAQLYERGCEKYGDRNWEKGMPVSRFIDSGLRHINDYRAGLRDEDHLIQAAWNFASAAHFDQVRPELNDLPRYITERDRSFHTFDTGVAGCLDLAEAAVNDYTAGLRDEDYLIQAVYKLLEAASIEHDPSRNDLTIYVNAWN